MSSHISNRTKLSNCNKYRKQRGIEVNFTFDIGHPFSWCMDRNKTNIENLADNIALNACHEFFKTN